MRKAILMMLLLISIAVAEEVDLNSAVAIANQYKHVGEHTNIVPQHQISLGEEAYWPIELVSSTNKIVTIIPIAVSDGSIAEGDNAKAVQKVHYLANFFYAEKQIEDFIDSSRDSASRMQADFQSRLDRLNTDIKPTLPVSITSLSAYENALATAVSSAEELRDTALELKSKIKSIDTVEEISQCQSLFNSFFQKESLLINALRELKERASDVREEINTKIANNEIDESYGISLSAEFLISGIESTIIDMEDKSKENRENIDSFFSSLDSTVDEYYRVLDQRIAERENNTVKSELWDKYRELNDRYESIVKQIAKISPAHRRDLEDIASDLEALANYIEKENLQKANQMAESLEEDISDMEERVGEWPPKCTGGKYWNGEKCVCPSGMKESNGRCVKEEGNLLNIVIAVIIGIAVITTIYYYSKGQKKEEKKEEPSSWSPYNFN